MRVEWLSQWLMQSASRLSVGRRRHSLPARSPEWLFGCTSVLATKFSLNLVNQLNLGHQQHTINTNLLLASKLLVVSEFHRVIS